MKETLLFSIDFGHEFTELKWGIKKKGTYFGTIWKT